MPILLHLQTSSLSPVSHQSEFRASLYRKRAEYRPCKSIPCSSLLAWYEINPIHAGGQQMIFIFSQHSLRNTRSPAD